MASNNHSDFNPYHKWLGIPKSKQPPTCYELLGISLDEEDSDVIRAAVEQRRVFVESKRSEGQEVAVNEVQYQINEAEFTLLHSEMRLDYDRRMGLFEKRKRRRRVDANAPRRRIHSRSSRSVSEDSDFVRTFAGIVAVLCVGFGVMAYFSFQLPWDKRAEKSLAAPAPDALPVVPAAVPQAKVVEQPHAPDADSGVNPAQAEPPSMDPPPMTVEALVAAAKSYKRSVDGNVVEIDVSNLKLDDSEMSALSGISTLRRLSVIDMDFTDQHFRRLAGLKELNFLDLWNTRITDASLQTVDQFSEIEYVNVVGNRGVTSAGLTHFSGCRRLNWLGLGYTGVSDDGMRYLTGLPLRHLVLYDTQVGDEGLQHLSAIKTLRTLKIKNTKVTDAGVARLQESLPNCKISR